MMIESIPQPLRKALTAVAIVAVIAPRAVVAQESQEQAPSGADASNPTAAVNYQDLRYRYFDLKGGADKHSFETEGAYMLHPQLKLINELRGVQTNRSGDYETDFEELKLKTIFLTDGKPFGIKAKYALGVEWLKDLGDFKEGTGTGSDKIGPLAGIGWMPTKKDFIITLVQYFHSYDEHDNAPDVRQTGPRLIYIRSLPSIQGWFKADFKGVIDHEDDADFTSTMELQLGKMLTPRVGLYAEAFLGDDALDSDAYESAFGLALRYMY